MAIAWMPLISEKFRMELWYSQLLTILHSRFISFYSSFSCRCSCSCCSCPRCVCMHVSNFYRFPTGFNHIIVARSSPTFSIQQQRFTNFSIAYDRNESLHHVAHSIRISFFFSSKRGIVSFSPRCVNTFQAYNFYEVTKFTFRTPNGIDPFGSKMRYRRSFFPLFSAFVNNKKKTPTHIQQANERAKARTEKAQALHW